MAYVSAILSFYQFPWAVINSKLYNRKIPDYINTEYSELATLAAWYDVSWWVTATTTLAAPVSFTLKRRPESIALLRDHQLVLTAPAPSTLPSGTVAFGALPAGVEISGARYQKRPPAPLLGDDFMRKDGWAQEGLARTQWLDDDT